MIQLEKEYVMRPLAKGCVMTVMLFTAAFCVMQSQTFTLIHINDTHAHLDACAPRTAGLEGTIGGIARAATAIMDARAGERNVLLVHGGDAFTGDIFFNMFHGVPELVMLRRLGVDAMTVGNHELDLGADALLSILNTADENGGVPPLLSANLTVPDGHGLGVFLAPSMTKTFDGLKVGIFGLTIPDPLSHPEPLVLDANIIDVAAAQVAALRDARCDVVICMSHCGIRIDRQLAEVVAGIDVIVGAHDHIVLAEPERIEHPKRTPTYIVQAGTGYAYVGRMTLTWDYGHLRVDDYRLIPVDASVAEYAPFQVAVDKMKISVETVFPEFWYPAVSHVGRDIEETYDVEAGERDTPAGTLITSAYLTAMPDAHLAITALGLVADKLHTGPVVPADLYRLVGYGFDEQSMKGLRIVSCRISGADLYKGLEIGVGSVEDGDEHVIQVGGMRFCFDSRKPAGERVCPETIVIRDQPFDPERMYVMVTNEAILGLLAAYGITVGNVVPGPFEYDALLSYVRMAEDILPLVDGRMYDLRFLQTLPVETGGIDVPRLELAPQPARDVVTLRYALTHPAPVRLAVYDVLGRCVHVVAASWRASGEQLEALPVSALPSGVYLMQFTSGTVQSVRRFAVVH
jgi:5'-nucleotidase / UDP-sugar diphosphatase